MIKAPTTIDLTPLLGGNAVGKHVRTPGNLTSQERFDAATTTFDERNKNYSKTTKNTLLHNPSEAVTNTDGSVSVKAKAYLRDGKKSTTRRLGVVEATFVPITKKGKKTGEFHLASQTELISPRGDASQPSPPPSPRSPKP